MIKDQFHYYSDDETQQELAEGQIVVYYDRRAKKERFLKVDIVLHKDDVESLGLVKYICIDIETGMGLYIRGLKCNCKLADPEMVNALYD